VFTISYAKFFSRSHDAVIRVYDEAGNVIETHEHAGDFERVMLRPYAKFSMSSRILQKAHLTRANLNQCFLKFNA